MLKSAIVHVSSQLYNLSTCRTQSILNSQMIAQSLCFMRLRMENDAFVQPV